MLWCCGAVMLWCCGAVMLWCCDAVVLWCCGAVVLWCAVGAVVLPLQLTKVGVSLFRQPGIVVFLLLFSWAKCDWYVVVFSG